jgi:predicted nucleic acid binding AN1-type Zn finger protein
MATPFYIQSPAATVSSLSTTAVPFMKLETSDAAPAKKPGCAHAGCGRKLKLLDLDCRCGERFCMEHRMPETHECTFDFRAAADSVLGKQLIKVVGEKITKF